MPVSIAVVIGGGQAAGQVVASLRQEGFIGRVILIGDEALPPYQRPPLSKSYLASELPPERLLFNIRDFYLQANIELRLGVRVTRVRLSDRVLELSDGTAAVFDHLIFATGSRPRVLDIEGGDHPRLLYLRTVADADRLRRQLVRGSHLALVGGGYLGLEIAATARRLDLHVSVLEKEHQLLPRVAGARVAEFMRDEHEQRGVAVHCDAAVTRVEGDGEQVVLHSSGAGRVTADLVVAAIGAVPNFELARDAGLVCNQGIVVDDQGRSSVPGVYAVGDCTEQSSMLFDTQLRLQSVPNAIEQARAAAAAICGKRRPLQGAPWFWSDQYDIKLQIAGVKRGHDQAVIRGDAGARSFAVYYLRGGRLIGIDAINRPAEFALARAWIADRRHLTPGRLADEAVPIRQLMS